MRIPSCWAASRIVVPSGTSIGLPSTEMPTFLPIALAWAMASSVRSIWLLGARGVATSLGMSSFMTHPVRMGLHGGQVRRLSKPFNPFDWGMIPYERTALTRPRISS